MTKHKFVKTMREGFSLEDLVDVLFYTDMEFQDLNEVPQRPFYDGKKDQLFASAYDMALVCGKLASLLAYCKNERPKLDWS